MTKSQIGKIRVEDEKILVIDDLLGWDKARLMSVDHKIKAFTGLSSLLFKPKANEIDVVYEEKRYEGFWHLRGMSRFDYWRSKKYQLPVSSEVKELKIDQNVYPVSGDLITLKSYDHCVEEFRKEVMVNIQTNKESDFSDMLRYGCREIQNTDQLLTDGAKIVQIEARSSTLVRELLAALSKPITADEIIEESITVNELNLFFYPLYVFEFNWRGKDKKALMSINGATGHISYKANKITDSLKNSISAEDIFELGKEIAAEIIPGGGIAMTLGRKAVEMVAKKKN